MDLFTKKVEEGDIKCWTTFVVYTVVIFFVLILMIRGFGNEQETRFTNLTSISVINTMNQTVIFITNLGDIEIELFVKESPITAGNFKKLAESGFYDGSRFHRVISGFMIQGGDPLSKDISMEAGWGTGGPGYAIEDEFIEGFSNVSGTIAMANSGPNSGGSQFFINLADNLNLDWDKGDPRSKHPVFGKVVSGMEVVEKIGSVATGVADRPVEDVIIEKITIK